MSDMDVSNHNRGGANYEIRLEPRARQAAMCERIVAWEECDWRKRRRAETRRVQARRMNEAAINLSTTRDDIRRCCCWSWYRSIAASHAPMLRRRRIQQASRLIRAHNHATQGSSRGNSGHRTSTVHFRTRTVLLIRRLLRAGCTWNHSKVNFQLISYTFVYIVPFSTVFSCAVLFGTTIRFPCRPINQSVNQNQNF